MKKRKMNLLKSSINFSSDMNRKNEVSQGEAANRKRGQLLVEFLKNKTLLFIEKSPIQKGMKGLILNSEEGAIAAQLAERVGMDGAIIGVDANATNIEISKQKAAYSSIENIQFFHEADRKNYQNQIFDFVFARFIFSKSQKPMELLKRLFQLLRPGGWILVEDMDFSKQHCFPTSFAFSRYVELYSSVSQRMGIDSEIGSKLSSIFRAAKLEHVTAMQVPPMFLEGEYKHISSLTLEAIAGTVIKESLAVPAELNAILQELRLFEQKSDTMLSLPGIYQLSARRPL